MTLNDVNNGEKVIVTDISVKSDMRRRLRDIGVVEGTVIERIGESPFGDPVAFIIKGAVIALRNEVSAGILVE